jgi:DNA-binding transcriptional ArsR family regulator
VNNVAGKIADEKMIASVLAHPIRCWTLTTLAAREASPVDIGQDLGFPPSHIAYHVRLLRQAGLIELTEEVPRHGSIEHRYRAVDVTPLTSGQLAELPPDERIRHTRNALCFAFAEANCALSAGRFELEHHIGRVPMEVDLTGRLEVQTLYDFWFKELLKIKGAVRDRLEQGGRASTSIMAFGTFFDLPPAGSSRGSFQGPNTR